MNISPKDDVINSDDVELRIKELEELRNDQGLDEDEIYELKHWSKLRDELSGYSPDWEYGESIIHDSYFEEYMDEIINDCYDLPDLPSFMTITLDYDALRTDYTETTINGETYLIR